MTAKEKAIELYEFFEGYPLTIDWVKQCAIKCVDEIIYELDELPKIPYNERRLKHWKEVKEEIIKL